MACTQDEKSYVTYDEGNSSKDRENFEDERRELILYDVEDRLNDEWFTDTTKDGDNLDCILDYLKLQSHDDFVDIEDEAYKERMCKFLDMTYKKPSPITIENVEVTRVIYPLKSCKYAQIMCLIVFLGLGWHLEEIHVTWAHLEKKRTRLRTYTKSLEESCSQSVETASQA
nr:hypothetical protein [Tanacetum cinerariifolium]